MPYIKDSLSILAECATIDLANTRRAVNESQIRTEYSKIEEASEVYKASPEMVPIVNIEDEYYTEAQFIAPFMRDYNVKSIAEALDILAAANNLPEKSVGLLIESECAINEMINKAAKKEKETGNSKAKDAVMQKIDKAENLAKSLKDKGFPVKRKKSENKNK